MIVVDTNVIAYLYLPSAFTGSTEALLQRDPDWSAPILWRSEFRNVLTGCLRRKQLTLEQARAIQAEAESLLAGREYEVDSRDVLDLVSRCDCSAYDCEFVALAIRLDAPLVTMDGKLLRSFPKRAEPLGSR